MRIFTALTAGGIKDVEIATPTNEAKFSLNIPTPIAAPDKNAIRQPTPNVRTSPLQKQINLTMLYLKKYVY